MRASLATAACIAALSCWDFAAAYPDGAPWGAASLDNVETCSSCHFETDPVRESAAITVERVDHAEEPGARQVLRIRFEHSGAATAGFQILSGTGSCAEGRFEAPADDIEVFGNAARSTAPRTVDGAAVWSLAWLPPASPGCTMTFKIAVTAANDDGSPFGDVVHYREFVFETSASRDRDGEADR